ncbi:MAG: thiamine pyrophosphate-dependent dehydrogenase E1 component subunit alpha [Acidimicrobiia bacterium]
METVNDLGAELAEIDLRDLPTDQLSEWLEAMVLIREFETAADELSLRGKVPGGVHISIGQEAVAIGSIRALEPKDIIAGGHRSHHHALAKGLPADRVMAELYGKATGVVGGRGGTMHLADFSMGYFGGNGIVGAGVGIAMGAALGAQQRGSEQVVVGFVGDGGANTGRTWESVNLAAIWRLPLVVICENNLYAVETHTSRVTAGESIAARAAGFGLPSKQVDGQDIAEVYRTVREARDRAIAGDGPSFIEALTYRYHGHNTGESGRYRTAEEIEMWRTTRDPIARFARTLESQGLLENGGLERITASMHSRIEDAVQFAEESEFPDPMTALDDVDGWGKERA